MANTTTSKKKNTATGKKRTILSSIKDVYHSMMKNDELILSKVTLPLKDVMAWGKITKEQACLFSYFATLGINGEVWFDLGDVQNYIDCEWIDYCENIPDMDVLLSRGFFGLRYDFPYVKGSFNKSTQFYLPDCIEDILSYNKKFAPYEAKQNLKSDTLSFLYRCKQENFNKKRNYYVDSIQSFYSDNKFLAQFTDFANNPFEGEALGIERSLLFFVFAGTHLLEGDSSISVKGILSSIEDNNPNWLLRVLKSFKEEKNIIIKEDYLGDIIETPGDIMKIYSNNINLEAIEELSNKIINKLNIASYPNTLSIVDKINYKDEYDKIDFNFFLKVLRCNCLDSYIRGNDVGIKLFQIVNKNIIKLNDLRINKKILITNMLTEMWLEVRK